VLLTSKITFNSQLIGSTWTGFGHRSILTTKSAVSKDAGLRVNSPRYCLKCQMQPARDKITTLRQSHSNVPETHGRVWAVLHLLSSVLTASKEVPARLNNQPPKRETSANTRSNLIHSLAASVRRGNSSSNRTVNTNLLKSTKKPSIGSSIGKQGTK
jgi:hypothetical protein